MGNKSRTEAGFTLVEMLVGLSICAVLVGAALAASSGARHSSNFTTAQNQNVLATKRAMEQIVRELRYADGMTSPNNSSDIGTPQESVDYEVKGLRRVIAKSPDNSITVSYYDLTGNVSKTVTLAQSRTDTLAFTRNAAGSMTVAIGLKDSSRTDNPVMNTATTIRLLNLMNP